MTMFVENGPDKDGIIVITMSNDGGPNVIDKEFVRNFKLSLGVALYIIREQMKDPNSRALYPGIIITGVGNSGFIAGANLHEILKVETREGITEFCTEVCDVFKELADENIPTVAAIDGPCLGGGLELALWCQYRIAVDTKRVSIGLPEVNLGLIPALGGASLMSRLLPFPKALDVVCGGKRYSARDALAVGLIDRVAAPNRLREEAKQIIRTWKHSKPKRRVRRSALDSKFGRNVISMFAKKNIRKRTNGNYPAPERAVDVMRRGLKGESIEGGLRFEREAVADLLVGQGAFAKRLIHIFLDQEARKKTYPNRPDNLDPELCGTPKKVGIIGAGLMGLGIAQLAAYKGIEVAILDVNQEAVDSVPARVAKLTSPLVKRRKLSQQQAEALCARVSASTDVQMLEGCDFYVEAVIEDMDIKHKVLSQIQSVAPSDAVIATNTSSLSVEGFASAATHPDQVIGMHFFSPVHRMPLVEIIPHPGTSPEAIERAFRFAGTLGKVPILCNDSTGFIVNRILGAYLNEAAWCCVEGHTPDAIDRVMCEWGMPLGPCELMDEVGIFVSGEVAKSLQETWPENRHFDVPVLIEQMIERNCLGKRSKEQEGFYCYKSGKKKPSAQLREIAEPLRGWYSRTTNPLNANRFIEVMRLEAEKLLEERVAHSATDIDLALVLGTGYPPFREPLV